jgi:hypothetical protein
MSPSAALLALSMTAAGSPVSIMLSAPSSASAIFEATTWLHYSESRTCERPARGIPGRAIVRLHIRGILTACARFWPGEEWAPYRMLTVLISEGNGHLDGNAPPGEKTYGPYCTTVEEVRSTCSTFRDIPCPRPAWEIKELLCERPEWAALVTAGTLWRYDRAQGGDRMLGTLMYKLGDRRLRDSAEAAGGVQELRSWRQFSDRLTRVFCLRDRVLVSGPYAPCGCER